MRTTARLTVALVLVALILSLTSCADFGVGESEDDFKKYFSGVYVLTKRGVDRYLIEDFNRDISLDDMDIPIAVPHGEYCYIGLRVAEGYTLSLSEFAFFAKSEAGDGVLELEFYIVDKMPTSIKDDTGADVEIPPTDVGENTDTEPPSDSESTAPPDTEEGGEDTPPTDNGDGELREEDVFISVNRFHTSEFNIGEQWNSILLEFDGSKTVNEKQFVIVRVNNNCYISTDEEEETNPSVSFTFNYLLFHFTDAHKE